MNKAETSYLLATLARIEALQARVLAALQAPIPEAVGR